MTRKPSIFQAGPVANDMQQPKPIVDWLFYLEGGTYSAILHIALSFSYSFIVMSLYI